MKRYVTIFIIAGMVASATRVRSQDTVTLTQCYDQAIQASPLQKSALYLESIAELNSSNHRTINYPKLMLNAQASYQSDVFSLPFQVPGIESPVIPQDQYKAGVDFYQNIYNGGLSRSVMAIENAKMNMDKQALEISWHQIREVINSLYFGVLKAQEQIRITENIQQDLNNNKKIIEAGLKEGAVMPITLKVIEKEILTLEQKLIEIEALRSSLLEMLGQWIEQPLRPEVQLELPQPGNPGEDLMVNRAESRQFDLQVELLEARKEQLATTRIPDIGLFGTAGVGYPNPFNWFEVEFAPYWLAGIKLSWNVLDFNKTKREKEVLGLQQQNVLAARENFDRTVRINAVNKDSDIRKFELLIEKDRQIVELQQEIVATASSQLENGIINSTEYVQQVNKELNARISLRLHEIDLEQAKIDLLTVTGNSEKL